MSKARHNASPAKGRGDHKPLFVYEGWYAVVSTSEAGPFWAAWWTGEPVSAPWRTPDATGSGRQSEADLAADAQRRIRAVKGQGALVRELHVSFARAAQREAGGSPPRHQPPPPPRKPRSEFKTDRSRDSAWREACARAKELEAELDALRAAAEAAAKAVRETWPHVGAPVSDFALLGLPMNATAEDIGRAYRRKVSLDRIHPDHGGDAAMFRAVTGARDRALAYASG